MIFSSREQIDSFHLHQTVFLHGQPIEEWKFQFGAFVIPGSTNSWQTAIQAAGEGNMIPPEILSGNVIIETKLYDGINLLATTSLRVFYD
jgi:retinal rod rhodopsin-sensitive cGMP 3',5'-cyclic phosphodiesterase subunit delta